MDFRKLEYSKCPNCKLHSIPVLKVSRWSYDILKCKYCGKMYKLNRILFVTAVLVIVIGVAVIKSILEQLAINLPMYLWTAIDFSLIILFDYFAPLEEVEQE